MVSKVTSVGFKEGGGRSPSLDPPLLLLMILQIILRRDVAKLCRKLEFLACRPINAWKRSATTTSQTNSTTTLTAAPTGDDKENSVTKGPACVPSRRHDTNTVICSKRWNWKAGSSTACIVYRGSTCSNTEKSHEAAAFLGKLVYLSFQRHEITGTSATSDCAMFAVLR